MENQANLNRQLTSGLISRKVDYPPDIRYNVNMKKESSFEIKTIEQIRTALPRSNNKYGIPKSVSFVFQELYKDIVTGIQTVLISADYFLYNMQDAYQENKEFSDISYWGQGASDSEINQWWIFGADGQGDLWLFDTKGKVFFYDHDKECMCEENFKCMEIDFSQWLQLAFLFRLYEKSDRHTNEDKDKLKNELSKINENLIENLPFDYELCI